MTHLDEDTLLRFSLRTLAEADYEDARQHIEACEQCGQAQRRMHAALERIAGIELHVEIPEPPGLPVPARRSFRRWRWIAGLAAGFVLGFLVARISIDDHPNPVPQRLVPAELSASRSGYVSCPALEIHTDRR